MYEITKKEYLSKTSVLMNVKAPLVAAKAEAGQFIILRSDKDGERLPFTIADSDRETGEISIVFQAEGSSTKKLALYEKGDFLEDFVGPLGKPAQLEGLEKALIVCGGTGVANAYPVTKKLFGSGCVTDAVLGFKTRDRVMLDKHYAAITRHVTVMTEDGSFSRKGRVTDGLAEILEREAYDRVFVMGPLTMMRDVCLITKQLGVATTAGMSTIMLDGTGICGGCRLTVDGKTKFACVAGPDFDGHAVDFDEAINRSAVYGTERAHACNLFKENK